MVGLIENKGWTDGLIENRIGWLNIDMQITGLDGNGKADFRVVGIWIDNRVGWIRIGK